MLVSAGGARAQGHWQGYGKPESLVLQLDPTFSASDRVAIRTAVAAELGIPVSEAGPQDAATLVVAISDQTLQLDYREPRNTLRRQVALPSAAELPKLLAQVSGNMVRNEALSVLSELASEPPKVAPAAQPPVPLSAAPATCPACASCEAQKPCKQPPFYLADSHIFSVLAGGVPSGDEQLQLTLQYSRTWGRLELGLGTRLGYGRVNATALTETGTTRRRVSAYQLTIPLSAEYRVLGGSDAYLQLGGYVGYRFAGFMNQDESVASGSDGDFEFGLQATVGFRIADRQGIVARLIWESVPTEHRVSSSAGLFTVDALRAPSHWSVGRSAGKRWIRARAASEYQAFRRPVSKPTTRPAQPTARMRRSSLCTWSTERRFALLLAACSAIRRARRISCTMCSWPRPRRCAAIAATPA